MLRHRNYDEEDDETLDEQVSFLGNGTSDSGRIGSLEIDKRNPNTRPWGLFRPLLLITISIFSGIIVSISNRSGRGKPFGVDNNFLFSCPAPENQDDATNDSGESFEEMYGRVSRDTVSNKTEFVKSFRTQVYDGWGKSYNEMKKGMTPFKMKYFIPYLKTGMKIYESACGIGLNLLMTLEIFQQVHSEDSECKFGTGITVYGNEYVKESVELSEVVLGDVMIPAGSQRGVICTGDSTNLNHVPSNAFDLVYTGYITPIQDPLSINPTDDWGRYDDICSALNSTKANDWMGQKLWDIVVNEQRDWYGKWVGEMARIAKPGTPVIVEQVSLSYCTNQYDWGGVDQSFWFEAASENTYNWNIDPGSVEIMADSLHEHRYHVFMLKHKDR